MANNKRENAYKGAHSKVSYPKKPGPKKAPKGKQESPQVKANRKKSVKAESKQFTAKLVAALALQRGESMDAGMARMCLTVAMQLFEEADLKLEEAVLRHPGGQGTSRRRRGDRLCSSPDRPVFLGAGQSCTEVVPGAQARGVLVQGRAHVRGEGVEDHLDAALRP